MTSAGLWIFPPSFIPHLSNTDPMDHLDTGSHEADIKDPGFRVNKSKEGF
jgi:hypothetical protein